MVTPWVEDACRHQYFFWVNKGSSNNKDLNCPWHQTVFGDAGLISNTLVCGPAQRRLWWRGLAQIMVQVFTLTALFELYSVRETMLVKSFEIRKNSKISNQK